MTLKQLDFFAVKPARDLDAANRALARLRAQFGETSVVRARLRAGHLPEARYVWERLDRLVPAVAVGSDESTVSQEAESQGSCGGESGPSSSSCAARPMVRRIFAPALRLPARPRQEPDGWMLRGIEHGPVVRVHGPYIISGGWWKRRLHREYHFVETQKGEVLWVYYDRYRRRWCIQGRVE